MAAPKRASRKPVRFRAGIVCSLAYVVASFASSLGVADDSNLKFIPPIGGQNPKSLESFAQAELLISFQGKGSSLSWDSGVIKRAFECLPALADGRVLVAGNSSGSAYAVYFSCFGFSPSTLAVADRKIAQANFDAVRANEDVSKKAAKIIRKQPTEIPRETLREVIAFALGVDGWRSLPDIAAIVRASRAAPRRGVVIAAANGEVLDNRDKKGTALSSHDYKLFDPTNFGVSWKPDVYEFYRRRPEQFAKEHPKLRLGPTPYIGKALTYFVDPSMYELLSRIPSEERLGDLRLMTTPADMALAIQASTAEPSYFVAVDEVDYAKLQTGDRLGTQGNSRRRSYVGGFIMPLVAQDVRRMLPSIRVLGTGAARVPYIARQLVKSWYLVDLQSASDLHAWWTDLEVSMPRSVQNRIIDRTLSPRGERQAGFERSVECFATDTGLPKYVVRPDLNGPAREAIVAPDRPVELEQGRLKTMRGLGPLLGRE
jgi:hypothetical protein